MIESAALDERAQSRNGLRDARPPAQSREIEPFGDQCLACCLDDAGADGQSSGLGIGVAYAVAIAAQVTQHLYDSLSFRMLRAQVDQRPNDPLDPVGFMAPQMAYLLELSAATGPPMHFAVDEHKWPAHIVSGERLFGDRTFGLGERRMQLAFEVFPHPVDDSCFFSRALTRWRSVSSAVKPLRGVGLSISVYDTSIGAAFRSVFDSHQTLLQRLTAPSSHRRPFAVTNRHQCSCVRLSCFPYISRILSVKCDP